MSAPYVLYNITLPRPINYPAHRLQTLQSARYALHHLTQRQNSCVALFSTANNQVLALRVSKHSKHKFPRNYFKKYSAFVYLDTGDLVVFDFTTGEVVDSIPISEL